MDFKLSDEQLMIQAAAHDFARDEIVPIAAAHDQSGEFPRETIAMMGELGLMGIQVPEAYGGSELDTVAYALAMIEISAADASHGTIMSVNNSLYCNGILTHGTEEQKQKYLPALATGEKIGAFCLSEPEAGSDATSQKTTAKDAGDHYVLNGTKNWITNGNSADIYLVIAQTYPEKGHKGINAFIVEADWDGVEIGAKLGAGNFGEVFAGSWAGSPIALKRIHAGADESRLREVTAEARKCPHMWRGGGSRTWPLGRQGGGVPGR